MVLICPSGGRPCAQVFLARAVATTLENKNRSLKNNWSAKTQIWPMLAPPQFPRKVVEHAQLIAVQIGDPAVAVYRGPYNRMNEAHDAIRKWMAANCRESGGHSWEIYGDPAPDPADTETTAVYLLK